uniref:Uncharacterized protein n=1 Tax=Rhizophora mucronata TaxID=61149 RepID=A0A2P2N4H6_RHIMU
MKNCCQLFLYHSERIWKKHIFNNINRYIQRSILAILCIDNKNINL